MAVRCRPINEDEEKRGFVPIVSCDTEKRLVKISYGTCMRAQSGLAQVADGLGGGGGTVPWVPPCFLWRLMSDNAKRRQARA